EIPQRKARDGGENGAATPPCPVPARESFPPTALRLRPLLFPFYHCKKTFAFRPHFAAPCGLRNLSKPSNMGNGQLRRRSCVQYGRNRTMILENTGLNGLRSDLAHLDESAEKLGFVRWQWEYRRATYDLKLHEPRTGSDYYLRINTRAVEGRLENPDA